MKHADASAVTLRGWQHDERLMLVIEDDGSGFTARFRATRFYLTGMRERNGAGWHIDDLLPARHACQRFSPNNVMLHV
ncbi:hypothetical protein DMI62_07815 [Escherichia coli]|nr:hypothetical protein [Escherichia coli]